MSQNTKHTQTANILTDLKLVNNMFILLTLKESEDK